MNEYKDYGWSEGATCAHSYLFEDLLKLLDKNINSKILDVGCGNGNIANKLNDLGFDVYGIDASISGIEIARKKSADSFFVQDINSKELPGEIHNIKFNTIISTEVIEHLYDPRGYVEFCKRVLMKSGGGELIISTPYHGYLKNLTIALFGKMDTHFTVLWDGGHIKFWSRATLTKLLKEYGFKVTDFVGSGRISYLWKSMFIKVKI